MIKALRYLFWLVKYIFVHRKGLLRLCRISFSIGEVEEWEYLCGAAVIHLSVFLCIDIPVFCLLALIGIFFI